MSIIRPDQFNPPHKGNSQRSSQGLGRFYMSAAGLNQGEIPSFTPLVAQDYSSAALGSVPAEDWRHSEIVESPAFSGNHSARLGRDMAIGDPIDPDNCGGAFYGRRQSMATVTLGHTVWQRFRIYIPSTFSWGFAYSSGDSDNPCGRPSDGASNSLKWLVFSPNSGTARIYVYLDCPRRQVAQKESPNIRVLIEAGAQTETDLQSNFPIPTDQWVSFQLAVKVSNTLDGWARLWVDDELICELTDVNTVSSEATGLNEWGIGDYWNGVPWSDGAVGREHFYVDDIIVATDMNGAAPPPTSDIHGNRYIANSITVGDL